MTDAVESERPSIAAAIVVSGDRVLLVRRRIAEPGLSWQLPAGSIENGESPADAAARETCEEAGIVVTPVKVLGSRIHPATRRHMVYVVCEHVSGRAHVADEEELAEIAWCTKSEIAHLVPHGLWEPVQCYLDTALAA